MIKTVRLKLLIAGGLCGFAVVPLMLLSAGYVLAFKDRFVAISMSPLNETAVEMGHGVDMAFDEIARNAALAAADADHHLEKDQNKTQGLNDLLNRDMARMPRARAIALIDADGHVVVSAARGAAKLEGDVSNASWFKSVEDASAAVEIDGVPTRIDPQVRIDALDDRTSAAIVEPVVATVRTVDGHVRGFWVIFVDHALFNDILSGAYTRTGVTGGDVGDAWEDFDIVGPDNTILFAFKADSSTTGYPDDARIGQPVLPFIGKLLAAYDGNSVQFGTADDMAYSALKAPGIDGGPKTGWSLVAKTKKADIMASTIRVEHAALIGIVLFAALAVLCGILFGSAITTPLLAIAARMRALQMGSKTAPVPDTDAGNEFGDMARAVESFRLAALDRDALEARAQSERQVADALRQSTEAARAGASHEQGQVVERLGQGLSRLADGDLTYRLPGDFPGAYAKLRTDFDTASGTLGMTIAEMTTAIEAIRFRNQEITHGADDLARRTEQQAAGLEETAASLDGLTTTIRSTAQGAASAEAMMTAARGDAQRSTSIVAEAVAAMTAIKSSAGSITKVIEVINDMASQTNLLALNAGVEAARAGEAGRGFAVVATEVRALAQRSTEAAQEIKALIETSGQHVGEGVRLVGETGQALGAILRQVDDVHGVIRGIAGSTKEQSTSLQEINAVITQMDQITQKNAAMAEESHAACHGLMAETGKLSKLAASFKIDGVVMPSMPTRRRA